MTVALARISSATHAPVYLGLDENLDVQMALLQSRIWSQSTSSGLRAMTQQKHFEGVIFVVQRCHRDFQQLPAWLQLEAMRQLEKRLTDVQNTPHNAAEIFAGIIYKLQRDPPSEPNSFCIP